MTTGEPPLSGLRVLELAARGWGSAALAGRILGSLGADVVLGGPAAPARPEPRSPDWMAALGKRRLGVDLTAGPALPDLRRLLPEADVVVVDQDTARSLGARDLGPERIAEIAPAAVVLYLTPFGLTGPLAGLPGSELTVQAATSMMATNGYAGDPPVRAGVPIAAMGGAFLGTAAVLAGLYERTRSGLGQVIDHAEYDTLIGFLGTWLPGYELTGETPRRIGNRHALSSPWNSYPCADGWLIICTVNQSQFEQFAEAIGRADLVADTRFLDATGRTRDAAALDAEIEKWTMRHSRDEALELLTAAEVVCGPIPTLEQVLADPHAAFRGAVTGSPEGPLPGPLVSLSGTPMLRPDPADPGPAELAAPWPAGAERFAPTPYPRTAVPPRTGADPATVPAHADDQGPDSSARGPLAGLRVVEVCAFTAGPLVGRLLGILGAEVIKVEPPAGEVTRHMPQQVAGVSYMFHVNNTDKLDCTLDMNDPADRETLRDLAAGADVFLTNLMMGTLRRNDLGPEDLAGRNPGLVYGVLTGFGSDGPYGGRKAFDTVVQSLSGIMALTGFPDKEPLKVAVSISDLFSACSSTVGLLAALVARDRTGRGQVMEAALYDASVWSTHGEWWRIGSAGAGAAERLGNRDARHCPHDCFPAIDGPVAVAVETDEQWAALAGVIERPDLAADPGLATAAGRLSRSAAVEEAVVAWTSTRSSAAVVDALTASGVPAGVPLTLPQAVESEHTAARRMIVSLDYPEHGPLRLIGSPFNFSRTRVAVRTAPPLLGEHNERILRSTLAARGSG